MVKIIRILYDRFGEKRYLAFDLFIYPLCNILKQNISEDTKMIHNIRDLEKDLLNESNKDVLLILFLNDLYLYTNKYGYNIHKNMNICFIHADFFYNHSKQDQHNIIRFVNNDNCHKCYVLEYSSKNIFYYNNSFKNIRYFFLPLLHNNYIETFYNSLLINGKISWESKDIDIVFMGDYSKRRRDFFENLKNKYNVCIITGNNNYKEIINLIERSKIFVNIFSKETNKSFDYFRLALLYSNSVFVITETPKVNFQIENNLLELKNTIITSDYNNMTSKIDEFMNKSGDDIRIINTNIYDAFSKYTLEKYVEKFFDFFDLL